MRTELRLSRLLSLSLLSLVATTARSADLTPQNTLVLSLPTQAPTAKCSPAGALGPEPEQVTLQRSFFDPFDRLDLSSQRWLPHYDGGYDLAAGRWLGYDWGAVKRTLKGNAEQQLYVDPGFRGTASQPLGLDPFRVRDGVLSIVAQRTPAGVRDALYGYEFISGVLTSRASLVQRYGYFEMRARIPAGKALWPAFWLLPANKHWPPEIDILEVVGQQGEVMVTTTHSVGPDGKRVAAGCRTTLPGANTGFHLFGALWTPQRIVYFFDRVPVAQLATPPGIDQPMYMLLNMAVGGNMVGRADDATPLPASFEIDWVAAWALPGNPPCETRLPAAQVDTCPSPAKTR